MLVDAIKQDWKTLHKRIRKKKFSLGTIKQNQLIKNDLKKKECTPKQTRKIWFDIAKLCYQCKQGHNCCKAKQLHKCREYKQLHKYRKL